MTTTNVVLTPNVDTDQSTSLSSQIAAVPDGTIGSPNTIILPKGRFRIDSGLHLIARKHLRIITVQDGVTQYPYPDPAPLPTVGWVTPPPTPDWNEFFTSYTDRNDLDRQHYRMSGCEDVVFSFCAIDGPWLQRLASDTRFSDYVGAQEGNNGFMITSTATVLPSIDCGFIDCYAINVGGDGFTWSSGGGGMPLGTHNVPRNCFAIRCQAYYTGRHGLTISSAEVGTFTDILCDWGGYAGIDIEPNADKAHCWDATFIRCVLGGFRHTFQAAGSNSDREYERKRNLRFVDCVAIRGQSTYFHISGGPAGSSSANSGYCIFTRCRLLGAHSKPFTAYGFDDVIVEDCVAPIPKQTATTSGVQSNPRNSLTITGSTFVGTLEGADELYDPVLANFYGATIVHYGNVWNFGNSNDGVAPPTTPTGPMTNTIPMLTQAATGIGGTPPVAGEANTRFSGQFGAVGLGGFQFGNPETVTSGIIAQTIPMLTQSATGTIDFPTISGGITNTIPMLTQSATGTRAFGGPIAQTLPMLTQEATGVRGVLEHVWTVVEDPDTEWTEIEEGSNVWV